MGILEHIFTFLLKIILIIFFCLAIVLYSFQIISRSFFSSSHLWISPLINYLFIVSAFYGSALAIRTNENIKIDVIKIAKTNSWIRLIINIFALGVTFTMVILFHQHLISEKLIQNSSDFYVPIWYLDIPMLLLFISSVFYHLNDIYVSWITKTNDKNRLEVTES